MAKEDLVLKRMTRLLELAERNFGKHPERSHRYMELARKLAMRTNHRIPKEIRSRMCDKCHRFLVPGENSTVRLNDRQHVIVTTCTECGNIMRHPYRKEKSKFNKNKDANINR